MSEKMSSRDFILDFLKGLAIIMVVLGHIICEVYDMEQYNTNIVFKVCYSVHMPLFIYISGYLTGKSKEITNSWLIRRIKGLLIPYVVWTVVRCIIFQDIHLFNRLLIDPFYWFLINLFIYHLITWLSHKFRKSTVTEIILYSLFIAGYLFMWDSNLVIKNVVMFFPFYIAGRMLSQCELLKRSIKILSLAAYPVSMLFFTYKQYGEIAPVIAGKTGISNIAIIKAAMLFYNHYVVAALGILFLWVISDMIGQYFSKSVVINGILYLGRSTLPIYVMHEFFFLRVGNRLFGAIFSFLVSIILSIVIYELISRAERLSQILFGGYGTLFQKRGGKN